MSSTLIRTALVDATGLVVNVAVVDPTASWEPDEGLTPIRLDADSSVAPGWRRNGNTFEPPVAEAAGPQLPTVLSLQAQLDQLMLDQLGL